MKKRALNTSLMRTQIFNLFLLLTLTAFVSCNNDDDNTIQNETISGIWHLKNVSGGLQGTNIDYTKGEVKWTFGESDGTLTVENNIDNTGPEDIFAGLDSGVYAYEVQKLGQTDVLNVEGNAMGTILLSSASLKIDEGVAVDGLIREFIR